MKQRILVMQLCLRIEGIIPVVDRSHCPLVNFSKLPRIAASLQKGIGLPCAHKYGDYDQDLYYEASINRSHGIYFIFNTRNESSLAAASNSLYPLTEGIIAIFFMSPCRIIPFSAP